MDKAHRLDRLAKAIAAFDDRLARVPVLAWQVDQITARNQLLAQLLLCEIEVDSLRAQPGLNIERLRQLEAHTKQVITALDALLGSAPRRGPPPGHKHPSRHDLAHRLRTLAARVRRWGSAQPPDGADGGITLNAIGTGTATLKDAAARVRSWSPIQPRAPNQPHRPFPLGSPTPKTPSAPGPHRRERWLGQITTTALGLAGIVVVGVLARSLAGTEHAPLVTAQLGMIVFPWSRILATVGRLASRLPTGNYLLYVVGRTVSQIGSEASRELLAIVAAT